MYVLLARYLSFVVERVTGVMMGYWSGDDIPELHCPCCIVEIHGKFILVLP